MNRDDMRQRLIIYLGEYYIDEDRPLTDQELNEGYENPHTLELLVDEWVEQKRDEF